MDEQIRKIILDRIEQPGWVATRGVLRDPRGQFPPEEITRVEIVMKQLAQEGRVALWTLFIENEGVALLAAARPGLELDKDLEERGAWAKATRYEEKT
jgi:hypothetical protein